eukprot:CAMPEP_0205815046 /NCGR_PEP_ID=MMETSP0205-20121125/20494_1 /ASSEMBLY_ACC=CAM_ASM_000278 /TAXON_ID=36767 /ORGANISM="Euplotes focardii, Strain TN1" /LENGTH=309 /DNA_ID=CAMNT_0053100321 /DNA_START=76 /DNA_END=1001 /DNA_ORIENTATION=-
MLYSFVYQPYALRRKYGKYPNVVMSKKYTPLLGEYSVIRELAKQNKYQGYFAIEDSLNNPQADFRLTFSGKIPYFMVTSSKSLDEFKKLVPKDIDRWDYTIKSFGRMSIGSLDQLRSNSEWRKRRDAIMKTIGINFSSRFIPLMLSKIKKAADNWKVEEFIDFGTEMKNVTFEIITEILFGRDIKDKIGLHDYKDFNGKVTQKDFQDYFLTLTKDTIRAKNQLHSIMFPFLVHNNLFKPNNIVQENVVRLWDFLNKFLSENKDDNSVFSRVSSSDPSIDRDFLMKDMILYYFAGHDTSSHGISSIIFHV